MNRQEMTISIIEELAKKYANSPETRYQMALINAIDALKPSALDPETGLVRCGCGGKPYMMTSHANNKPYYIAHCNSCPIHIGTYSTYQKAEDAWNRAMGYKEAQDGQG